jgi:DNA-binding Lrp family transcriptional regulator
VADGSYFFARFADRRKLTGIEDVLQSLDSVARWDAVDGYFGLAVQLKGQPEADLQKIQALEGLTESVESRVISDLAAKPLDQELCGAYVLVEVDPEKSEQIAETIDRYEETLDCVRAEGRFGLVVILQSASFDEIDDTIDDKISSLDGVLRLKEGRIISSHVK